MSDQLLDEFKTPFQSFPFDKVKTQDYLPAIKKLIEEGKEDINHIVSNEDEPTFENTIIAMEKVGRKLSIVSGAFFNLNSAHTSDEMQALAKDISPILTEYSNDITLNDKLFTKIKSVFDRQDQFSLSGEDQRLLEKTYTDFTRNGALLNDSEKEELRKIDNELSKLSLDYSEKVLKETNSYELHITKEDDLRGLPKDVIEAAEHEAQSRKKEGWVFTLQFPSFFPFVTYCDNRELRQKILTASSMRANQKNENNNEENIKKILNLRNKRAKLLGFVNHADFVIQNRMATNVETVQDFLESLFEKSIKKARQDVQDVFKFAQASGLKDELKAWDYSYYSEKLKKEVLDFNDEDLKPYFSLDKVIRGVFSVASKLYGLSFKENNKIPVYHEDVKVYEVYNEKNELVSLFYGDFYSRESKRQGAWMTEFRGQYIENDVNVRPHVSIVCNFPKPTSKTPSLLTLNDVRTLFHEFGHALHGMLSNVKYETLSGPNVLWDFVELPSQILENWCYEKECLDLFAEHYETGEKLSSEMLEKIKKELSFQEGRQTMRQLSFAAIDLAWHVTDPSSIHSIYEFEKEVMKKFQILDPVEGAIFSTSFGHIFAGGYSAGYYSYKWAEVLDADAFELFKSRGIFDKETANSFRDNILSKGNSEHPMDLYRKFRGHDPSIEPLLKRAGLL
ncbi:MAG: M3 family metallopeptidase [Halobacteriovoraceae bacterium]|nr:M3 family metallopeptidase [Halobacteriovoraceae bacterium]